MARCGTVNPSDNALQHAALKLRDINAAPVPAAVIAWRHFLSWTSPAANTPGTLVSVVPGVVTMYPSASVAT